MIIFNEVKSKYQKEIVTKHGQFQLKRAINRIEIVLSEKCYE